MASIPANRSILAKSPFENCHSDAFNAPDQTTIVGYSGGRINGVYSANGTYSQAMDGRRYSQLSPTNGLDTGVLAVYLKARYIIGLTFNRRLHVLKACFEHLVQHKIVVCGAPKVF